MKTREEIVETAPASSGKTLLLKYLEGNRLSAIQSIRAKCCEYMGYYVDGRSDCRMPNCPLYPFMPYLENKEKKTSTRTISSAHKEKLRQARSRKSVLRS